MLDVLFFAVLAAIIFGRLWKILGQKDEDGGPATKGQRPFMEEEDDVVVLSDRAKDLMPPQPAFIAAPLSLAGTLARMAEKDPDFDEKKFLDGARVAFKMVVEAFAKGDIAPVSLFLAADVEKRFRSAIEARAAKGQTLEHTLHDIKEAEIAAATLEDSKARLSVRFTSIQTNRLHGEGLPEEAASREEIEDLWVFARDLSSDNPNWTLVETRS